MKLGAFLVAFGHHVAAWRHPETAADAESDFAYYAQLAHVAERGLFDLLFFLDVLAVPDQEPEILGRTAHVMRIDPFVLLAGLASVTTDIGLVCTMTTTYNEPYLLARRFAALDHISGGRAGWNLITSGNAFEALQFGITPHPSPEERYKRAREFAEVVRGLWDSWDDDAFTYNKASGLFFEPEKMHSLNHAGAYFQVRGPLNTGRSPQGQPVIVQAGSSEAGKELAAETADVVFTAQPTLDGARAFYADVKARLPRFNREPESLKIMPGILPTVGRTQAEAQDKYDRLQELIDPKIGLNLLSQFMHFDLSAYPLDGPLPELPPELLAESRPALLVDMARRENLSIRQLYMKIAGGRGHVQIIGTPSQIADLMEEWFTSGAADGFNVLPPVLPGALSDFVDLVVPELQRRGLFRTQYEGHTLREKLGLERPKSRYASQNGLAK